eukprot:2241824-Amphidinium_carterae.1
MVWQKQLFECVTWALFGCYSPNNGKDRIDGTHFGRTSVSQESVGKQKTLECKLVQSLLCFLFAWGTVSCGRRFTFFLSESKQLAYEGNAQNEKNEQMGTRDI